METHAFGFRLRANAPEGQKLSYLMAIMSFESDGFNPAARNELSGATGLIQFMPSTAKELGTATDALARMSAEDQLDYVAAYFAPFKGRLNTLEDAEHVGGRAGRSRHRQAPLAANGLAAPTEWIAAETTTQRRP
jgi:hypothetical protein